MSNAIRAYLSDLERGFDSITYETPLDVAVEIEMVRQEGVTILKEAEGDARRIREEAREDAEATLSASKREAESASSSAREYYNSVVSIAHKEADAIRAQAAAEAETIKADAKHIAEERRERRSKRRTFIASHRKLVIGACLCLAAVIAALFTLAHRDIQAKLEAKLIPIGIDSSNCIGAQYREIETRLSMAGFTNVSCVATADLDASNLKREGTVRLITVEGRSNFDSQDQFPYDAKVEVYYLAAQELHAPLSSQDAIDVDREVVESRFTDAGFANVSTRAVRDLTTGFLKKPDTVVRITVDDNEDYSCSDTFRPDAEIVIYYHDYRWSH